MRANNADNDNQAAAAAAAPALCICIYRYVCMYIYIYIQRERERDMYTYIYIYIYIYIYRREPGGRRMADPWQVAPLAREESFALLLPERNPLLFYSQRGILYYSTPREESLTILDNAAAGL